MLYDAKGFDKIYIAPGYTDMRKNIDGLKMLVDSTFQLSPYQKNVLFLFCGRNRSKIKALIWEGDGFVLAYKRIEDGRFCWPRTASEVFQLTQEDFERLMQGLSVEKRIKEIQPKSVC